MKTRSVINLTRSLLFGLAMCVSPPALAKEQSLTLTLDQARIVALEALNAGEADIAVRLASGLLQASPKDPLAHYILATGHAQLKQFRPARQAAARAYRYAAPGPDRLRAAQLAAQMALAEDRPSLAQVWLRRTAIHAKTDREHALLARDYKLLRRINPWSFRLSAGLRPSSNINSGSDNARQIVNGEPDPGGGVLSGSARALSGVVGAFDLNTRYRLRGSQKSVTTLSGRLFVQRVKLSASAKAALLADSQTPLAPPLLTADDFGSTFAQIGLQHVVSIGPKDKPGSLSIGLAAGESWYGGNRTYRFVKLETRRNWTLAKAGRFHIGGSIEDRSSTRFSTIQGQVIGLNTGASFAVANGDRLNLSLSLRRTNAGHPNGSYDSITLYSSYSFGKRLGPARITAGLALGQASYDRYLVIFGAAPLLTHRKDMSVYGDISLFFEEFDYAGFAPTLRIRAGKKSSNIGRFDTRDLSVSLGIQSKF